MMINELTVGLSYQEMPFIPPVIFRLSLLYRQVHTECIIIVLGTHSLTVTLYIKAFMAGVGRGVTPESFQGRCPCTRLGVLEPLEPQAPVYLIKLTHYLRPVVTSYYHCTTLLLYHCTAETKQGYKGTLFRIHDLLKQTLGGGQPYLNLFKPIPILEAEGVLGLNRF